MKINSRSTKASTDDELISKVKVAKSFITSKVEVAKSFTRKSRKDTSEELYTEAKVSKSFLASNDGVVKRDDNGMKSKSKTNKSPKNIFGEEETINKKSKSKLRFRSKSKSKSIKDSLAKRIMMKMAIGSSSDANIRTLMKTTRKNMGDIFQKNIEAEIDQTVDKGTNIRTLMKTNRKNMGDIFQKNIEAEIDQTVDRGPASEKRDDSIATRDGCSDSRTTECESTIRSYLSVDAERDQKIEISIDYDTVRSEIRDEHRDECSTDNITMEELNIEDDEGLNQNEESSAEQKEGKVVQIIEINTSDISNEDKNQADAVDTDQDNCVENSKLSTDLDDMLFIESVPSILDMNKPIQGVFNENDAFFDDNDKQRDIKECAAACTFLSLFQKKR